MKSPIHHSDTIAINDVLEDIVADDTANHAYQRAKWIETVMIQMVAARVNAGLSQAELGARLGKPQSSIARTERAGDIKLSTLFDHLHAAGLTPAGELPCEPSQEQLPRDVDHTTRHAAD